MIRFHVLSLLILQAARPIARGRLRDSVQRHPLSQPKNLPLSQLEVCIFWVNLTIFLPVMFSSLDRISLSTPSCFVVIFHGLSARSCEYPTLLTLLLLLLLLVIVSLFLLLVKTSPSLPSQYKLAFSP